MNKLRPCSIFWHVFGLAKGNYCCGIGWGGGISFSFSRVWAQPEAFVWGCHWLESSLDKLGGKNLMLRTANTPAIHRKLEQIGWKWRQTHRFDRPYCFSGWVLILATLCTVMSSFPCVWIFLSWDWDDFVSSFARILERINVNTTMGYVALLHV